MVSQEGSAIESDKADFHVSSETVSLLIAIIYAQFWALSYFILVMEFRVRIPGFEF